MESCGGAKVIDIECLEDGDRVCLVESVQCKPAAASLEEQVHMEKAFQAVGKQQALIKQLLNPIMPPRGSQPFY